MQEKIARITYNKYRWIRPSGREGKSKAASYEKTNGFGHEEWLLDFSKILDGYHYGFLEPVNKFRNKYIGEQFNITLYTVNCKTKEKFWVGYIKNIEVISREYSETIRGKYINKNWYNEMKSDLDNVGLNGNRIDQWDADALFNIRFKIEDFVPYPLNCKIDKKDKAITSYHYVLLNKKNEPLINVQNEHNFILGNIKGDDRKVKMTKRTVEEKYIEYPNRHNTIEFIQVKFCMRF